jgi:hypothetical protein
LPEIANRLRGKSSQIEDDDKTPVYIGMLSIYTADDNGEKSVAVKTSGYKKMGVTVMLVVLADGTKLPPYVILNYKTMPKEQLPRGLNGHMPT